tara:strand:- start:7301 stop:8218 length:918 start_codon:yes stop_codon:yes gene_type:complete
MWNDSRVLVTGSSGFLGKALVERLESLDAIVAPFDLALGDDVTDARAVSNAVQAVNPSHIFHLAGNSIVNDSADSPWQSVQVNSFGTLNVLEAARVYMEDHALRAVVCSSSNHIYGKQDRVPYGEGAPFNHYGAYSVGKIAADYFVQLYAKNYGVPTVALRHTNTYGPEDLHDSHIVRGTILSLMAGEFPVIRSRGLTKKGYLYIDDTVDAYLASTLAPESGISALNASSTLSWSAVEIVAAVQNVMRKETEEMNGQWNMLHQETDENDEYLDSALIQSLGWRQRVPLREGIERTVLGMREAVPA